MATVGVVWVEWKSTRLPARWIDLEEVEDPKVRAQLEAELRKKQRSSAAPKKRRRADPESQPQLVHFFGSGQFAWRRYENLTQFLPRSASLALLSTPAGRRAVREAEDYCAKLQPLSHPVTPAAVAKPAARKRAGRCNGSGASHCDEGWESLWGRLVSAGWREQQQRPNGRSTDRYYIPPGVQPGGPGFKMRRDYFDSRKQVRQYARDHQLQQPQQTKLINEKARDSGASDVQAAERSSAAPLRRSAGALPGAPAVPEIGRTVFVKRGGVKPCPPTIDAAASAAATSGGGRNRSRSSSRGCTGYGCWRDDRHHSLNLG